MAVIAFVSQKGGVGKSTLARALAVEAARAGLRVRIADLDSNQATIRDWHADRIKANLDPVPEVQLHRSLKEALPYAGAVDLLVLDGPARADADTYAYAQSADLVVLPSGSSYDDLRPAIRVANSLVAKGIPAARLLFALTRISSDVEADTARAYIEKADYRVAGGYLPERQAYRAAQNTGRAVTETPYGSLRTAAERLIQNLIDAVPEE